MPFNNLLCELGFCTRVIKEEGLAVERDRQNNIGELSKKSYGNNLSSFSKGSNQRMLAFEAAYKTLF